jgi:hypothetical protein
MSEAFANRHHHCERVDSLNRGIWTSYGVGGTQDHPIGPAVEMYLRCNHDDCARIDWRTVHGLQCHIVKNHFQPKGTIGSLDKALERYGVPVKEVEDYERQHGRGSAGTMADPKNHKIKVKTREALGGSPNMRKDMPSPHGADFDVRPAGYQPSPSDSPALSDHIKRSPTVTTNGFSRDAPANDVALRSAPSATASASPVNTFSAIRTSWAASSTPLQMSRAEPLPKQLQGDFGASDAAKAEASSSQPKVPNGHASTSQPPTSETQPPTDKPSTSNAVAEPSKAVANADAPATGMNIVPSQPASAAPALQPETDKPEEGQKVDKPEAPVAAPAAADASNPLTDGDVEMTGTGTDQTEPKEDDKVNGQGDTAKKAEDEAPAAAPAEEPAENDGETIVVETEASKEASAAKKSTFQSPIMPPKTIPAVTPTGGRRGSRRFSVAKKSADGDLDDARGNVENEDKEGKDEKTEKESAKMEPRRSITGRLLRRGRF